MKLTWMMLVPVVMGLTLLAGCGAGVVEDNYFEPEAPVEIPTAPTAIGGSVYTFEREVISMAYNAEVTLEGVRDDNGQPYTATSRSVLRGGYQFANLPAGTYTVTARLQSTDEFTGKPLLIASIAGIRVKGNIPVSMINLVMCDATKLQTFTGTVTGKAGADEAPVPDAVVNVEVYAYLPSYLTTGDKSRTQSLVTPTTTDAEGNYAIQLPAGMVQYELCVVKQGYLVAGPVIAPPPDEDGVSTQPFLLTPVAGSAILPNIDAMDYICSTLAAPTPVAGMQASFTRLAIARKTRASADRLERFAQLARRTRTASTGLVENDLFWEDSSWPAPPQVYTLDPTMRGYKVVRSKSKAETLMTEIARIDHPYQNYYFDTDPALNMSTAAYSVIAVGVDGSERKASGLVEMTPLLQVELVTPAGAGMPEADAIVSWKAVAGAKSYYILGYWVEPTYNIIVQDEAITPIFILPQNNPQGEVMQQKLPIPANSVGKEIWWAVAAFDEPNPNAAHAASYSAYQRLVIQ